MAFLDSTDCTAGTSGYWTTAYFYEYSVSSTNVTTKKRERAIAERLAAARELATMQRKQAPALRVRSQVSLRPPFLRKQPPGRFPLYQGVNF